MKRSVIFVSLITTISNMKKQKDFKIGVIYLDHFNREVIITSFNDSKSAKPINAMVVSSKKQCFYHFNQLTETDQENQYDDLSDMTLIEKKSIKYFQEKGRFNLKHYRKVKNLRSKRMEQLNSINHQESFVI